MPRVVHFEFLSDDPEQSVKFFQEAFGWQNQSWPGQSYWLVDTGKEELGINGGIMRASDFPHTTTPSARSTSTTSARHWPRSRPPAAR